MIINSLLVTDAYKINMMQVVLHQFNRDIVKWAFKCRNEDVKFTPNMIERIRKEVDYYCSLRFTEDELEWLKKNFTWLTDDFIDYLRRWQPRRNEIFINENFIQAYNNCGLAIEAHGTELSTMMYEIAILAIVNEVYYAEKYGDGALDIEFQKSTMEKFSKLRRSIDENEADYCEDYKNSHPYDIGTFSEFGLRRRLSANMQDWLIKFIVDQKIPGFVGTSNVYLAKKYGVKAIGTQAHEFFMLQQGHFERNPAYSNMFAMKSWRKEYETQLGIALTDTIGTEVFLKDFGLTDANSFSGVRHDSGNPFEWGELMITHYKKLGIDPKTKTLLFSDSLNFEKATKIRAAFKDRINVAFGIGTYLAGVQNVPALNIVMKLVEVNGRPVAKLSNNDGKIMCKDNEYVDYLKRTIVWRLRYE